MHDKLRIKPKPIVCAVVLSDNPAPQKLIALIEKIRMQAHWVLVVDHAATPLLAQEVRALGATYLALGRNPGPAAAFNRGIAWAIAQQASHVLLLEQDSLPTPSMVRQLLFAEQHLLAMGLPLAALGPAYVALKTNAMRAVAGPQRWFVQRRCKPDFAMLIEAGHLACGGQLIRLAVLQQVGLLREELYSAAVEIEWSMRAQQKGLRSFVVADAMMQYAGAETATAAMQAAKASPLRHYYLVRNTLLLCRMRHIPWPWKLRNCSKNLLRLLLYPLFCAPRWQQLKWLLRAWNDGLRGRSGPAGRDS